MLYTLGLVKTSVAIVAAYCCDHCNCITRHEKYLLCAKCKSIRYCSVECQKYAYSNHKKMCTFVLQTSGSTIRSVIRNFCNIRDEKHFLDTICNISNRLKPDSSVDIKINLKGEIISMGNWDYKEGDKSSLFIRVNLVNKNIKLREYMAIIAISEMTFNKRYILLYLVIIFAIIMVGVGLIYPFMK